MNKEDLEKKGKEFVENVLKYSFNSMDTSTLANRFLKAFVAGAESILTSEKQEVQDKEPSIIADLTSGGKEYFEEQLRRAGNLLKKKEDKPSTEDIEEMILGQRAFEFSKPKVEQKLVVMFGTEAPRDMEQYLSEGWLVKDMEYLHSVSKILFLLERTN